MLESTVKGIAKRRDEDIAAFINALLPDYRAVRIENDLRIRIPPIGCRRFSDDDWLIDVGDAYDVMMGFGTAPWHLRELSIKGVTAELFHMEATFEDDDFLINSRCRQMRQKR